tara:strand:- start:33 stop:1205 length:1173 start_codon:yes stop_codon:yes gene_type:complete
MSIQTSRYESQNIVNAFNLFIDSEKSSVVGHGHSTGDDVNIHMEGNSLEAQDGEIIRLSLTSFTMFNNLYHVDNTNRQVRVKTFDTASGSTDNVIRLPRKNHHDMKTIATDFSQVLAAQLAADSSVLGSTVASFTVSALQPSSTAINATSDRILSFTLTAKDSGGTTVNHLFNTTGGVIVQCLETAGESYQLLGGLRVDDSSLLTNSFSITVTAQTVVVNGYFPMQRMTDPYVYIRCENVSNGLEMSVLDSGVGASSPDVINSNILAKVYRDHEFITYHTQSGMDYFLNLQQRRLSHLRLFLTDSKGRRLGRLPGETGGTAAGLGPSASSDAFNSIKQNTQGNLYFTAVVKLEVVRVRNPSHLDTTPPSVPMPAREAQSVMTWPDYGRPR